MEYVVKKSSTGERAKQRSSFPCSGIWNFKKNLPNNNGRATSSEVEFSKILIKPENALKQGLNTSALGFG